MMENLKNLLEIVLFYFNKKLSFHHWGCLSSPRQVLLDVHFFRNMLRCFAIAQADAHVTKSLVQSSSLDVKAMVEMWSSETYAERLKLDFKLLEYDTLLRCCYIDAKEACFTFKPDQFGGYGLFYDGKQSLCSSTSFRKNYLPSIVGYVEKIPAALVGCFADISLFEKTDLCKFDRIMVGATRFANHSCRPNCKYTIFDSGKRKAIKLEILKQVNPGDEITVFYSSQKFFGEGNQNCQCPHKDLHAMVSAEALADSKRITLPRTRLVYPQKRKRLFITKTSKNKREKIGEIRNFPESNSCSESSTYECDLDSDDIEDSSVDESSSSQNEAYPVPCISSPQSAADTLDFDVSTLASTERYNSDYNSSDSSESVNEFSLTGSSTENFLLCVHEIISRHGTSDAEAHDWLKLIRTTFSEKNIPSFKAVKRETSITKSEEKIRCQPCANGQLWKLDFTKELKIIIDDNLKVFENYSSSTGCENDLKLPPTFDPNRNTINIFLLMNSDGVRVINSNKQSLWPLWLAIANLPPVKRCMFRNIVLARLWFGSGKPSWDVMFEVCQINN